MLVRHRFLVVAAALLLCAGAAHAKQDFCFNSTSPPNPAPPENPDVLVFAQGFKVPKPGKCRAIVGWDSGAENAVFPRLASGTACLDSAGTRLAVGILIHNVSYGQGAGGVFHRPLHVYMSLPYPSLVDGLTQIVQEEPSLNLVRPDAVAGPCGFAAPFP